MSIDSIKLPALEPELADFKYDKRDTMLYSLGIGWGAILWIDENSVEEVASNA